MFVADPVMGIGTSVHAISLFRMIPFFQLRKHDWKMQFKFWGDASASILNFKEQRYWCLCIN